MSINNLSKSSSFTTKFGSRLKNFAEVIFRGDEKMKRAVLLLLFVVGAGGCAELKPMKISGSPSLEERKSIEKQHRVRANIGVTVGGRLLPYVQWDELEAYFRDCGCDEAARLIPKWKSIDRWAMILSLTGLVVYGASLTPRNDAGQYAGAALMLIGALGLDTYARARYLWPAAGSFNDCIRQQLGLAGKLELKP